MTRRASLRQAFDKAIRAARDTRGATAVEFAIVAGPLFLLLFAIIEVAIVFFVSVTLENAVAEAARDIRTGEVQNGGGQAQFEDTVCSLIQPLMECGANISFDVRTFEDFATAGDLSDPIGDDDELDDSQFGFDPGEEREIVLVRVYYQWTIFTPMLGRSLANLSGNKRLIAASAAFRNEPFGDS